MDYDPGAVGVRARRFLPYVLGFSVIAALLGTASAGRDEVTLGAIGHGAARVHPPIDNRNHLYVLDGWGGIHPVGASPALASTASWPTKDIAYSLALFPDGTGGYVMDGWGGLHPVGGAPTMDSACTGRTGSARARSCWRPGRLIGRPRATFSTLTAVT